MTLEYTAPYQSPPQQYTDLHHTQLTGNIACEELVTLTVNSDSQIH